MWGNGHILYTLVGIQWLFTKSSNSTFMNLSYRETCIGSKIVDTKMVFALRKN